MTSFRIWYEIRGGHVHCRVYSGQRTDTTHGRNGELCFRLGEEWNDFQISFRNAPDVNVEFIEDVRD